MKMAFFLFKRKKVKRSLDIFKLFGKIIIEDDEAHGKLGKIGEKASGIAGKFGTMAKAVGTATVAAVGAAATAVGAIAKEAIESYADYEQLVGGVETMFGNSADRVIQYAEQAYKSAGMSANEYMETVTGFSASLISSLGGNTVAAAEYADMAITDMSDNANKMGTSMESIQNAYQGFAKQNYTMLDNLKLGYGGTQSEMLRLVNDAAKLDGAIAKNNLSFANIVQAIHVVQDQMGITGTTATEASMTISGSIGAMKSAWSNLVTGIADDNANMTELIDNLVGTIVGDENGEGGVINNIIPRIEQSLEGVGHLVDKMVPIIIEKVPTLVNEWLPKILQSGVSMVQSILDGMLQNSGSITTGAVSTIMTFVNGILDNLPQILVSAVMLIGEFAAGLIQALPEILAKIPEIIVEIWNAFQANADVFLEIGRSIVVGIWEGIKALWGSLVDNFSALFSGLGGNVNVNASSSRINGSHADGLAYVPFDGYVAQLHEGERVLTKKEAREYNSSVDDKPIKIIVQSVLDGKVIGETAYNYSRKKARAGGI
jgi:hypothetical protein